MDKDFLYNTFFSIGKVPYEIKIPLGCTIYNAYELAFKKAKLLKKPILFDYNNYTHYVLETWDNEKLKEIFEQLNYLGYK